MTNPDREGRERADRILALRDDVARAVTEDFLGRHPDWREEYGERAVRHGVEDAGYHVDFLAGAVAAGSAEGFRRYAAWAARLLDRRGMAPRFLAENLEQIGRRLEEKLAPDDAEAVRKLVDAGVDAALDPAALAAPDDSTAAGREVRELYMEAALRGDRKAALTIAREALVEGMSVPDLYQHVLQEAQYEVGRRWADNRITVAREHTATAVCQYVLVRLYDELPRPEERRGRAVVTGVAGELHQVGSNMVADMLEMDGWEVRFLGTDMPHGGIVEAVEESEADLVAVSATMLFNLPRVSDLLESIRESRRESAPRLIVGGGAFGADEEAWLRVGADAVGRNLADAVTIARKTG